MNRRSFLRNLISAGACFLAGRDATGKSLLLISDSDHPHISGIEWILYRTGRQQADDRPEYRCAVRLTSASGVQGWADLAGSAMADHETASIIRDILLGRDPAEIDAIWASLYRQDIPLCTLAAVDIALWDLLARIEAKPVHALLGAKRQNVEVCASTGFSPDEPQKYVEYAVACKEAGIYGCKVQPYVGGGTGLIGLADGSSPDRDMALYQAVRQAVGPDFPCMADSACSYTFDDALRVGQLLDGLKYESYQSPMPESDDWLQRYGSLVSRLTTPICAPATNPGSYATRVAWIQAKACDIGAIDVHYGGFTACRELASACEAAGIPLQLTHIGPDSYPHLQLIAATAPALVKCYELPSLSREISVQPGRTTPEPTLGEQGRVAIPQTPGMGVELDWKHIFTHRVT